MKSKGEEGREGEGRGGKGGQNKQESMPFFQLSYLGWTEIPMVRSSRLEF